MSLTDAPIHTLQGQDTTARRVRRQGDPRGQRRLEVRPDAAVHRPRAAPEDVRRPWLHRRRLPVQPVRRAGARLGRGDRDVLLDHLRRDVPDDGEGRRQRRRPPPDLPGADAGRRRRGPQRRHPLELREVPHRARRRPSSATARWSRPTTRPSSPTSKPPSRADAALPAHPSTRRSSALLACAALARLSDAHGSSAPLRAARSAVCVTAWKLRASMRADRPPSANSGCASVPGLCRFPGRSEPELDTTSLEPRDGGGGGADGCVRRRGW